MKVEDVPTTAIDEWLPQYQVSARYSILVRATPAQAYAALNQASFSDLTILRVLTRLRGYRLKSEKSAAADGSPTGRRYGSFLQLAAVPPKEVLVGIAGRFWRPDGGIVPNLSPAEFRDFRREGYAKAVWNFTLTSTAEGTRLSTETRVQTFGRAARLKFRAYWLVVGPFSGLIRGAMLREVRRRAEGTHL
jgi:hypothetical protein